MPPHLACLQFVSYMKKKKQKLYKFLFITEENNFNTFARYNLNLSPEVMTQVSEQKNIYKRVNGLKDGDDHHNLQS